MRRILHVLLPLAATVIAATPASAQGGAWRVSEVTGDVRISEGGRTRAATRGTLLSGGSVIAGARARAVLVRGRQYVVVAPNSTIRVEGGSGDGNMVQMILDAGNAIFRVNRRETPHFRVQTRYLAAVVRGTTFSVSVTPSGGSVQVTEGAVEVSTPDGGAKDLIRPGMIASVNAGDLYQLSISGDQSRVIRSPAAPAGAGAGGGTVTSRPAARSAPRIVVPIGEAPVRLSDSTNGLVRGGGAVSHAADRAPARAGGPSGGRGSDPAGQAGKDGDRGDRGHGNDEDRDDEDNPGRGGGGEDRPGRDDRDEDLPGRGGDDDKPVPKEDDRPGRDDDDTPGGGNGGGKDEDEDRGDGGDGGDKDKPVPTPERDDGEQPDGGDKDRPDRGDGRDDDDRPDRGNGGGDDDEDDDDGDDD